MKTTNKKNTNTITHSLFSHPQADSAVDMAALSSESVSAGGRIENHNIADETRKVSSAEEHKPELGEGLKPDRGEGLKPDMWDRAAGLLESWYVACTSDELKAKPKSVQLFERKIALFRGADGKPAALVDQCVHRGTRLSGGVIYEGCLQCPYHGWSYNAQGHVTHVPSLDGYKPGAQNHRYRQRSFPVREQQGLIWLYLGEQEPATEPYQLPFYDRPDFVSYYMQGIYEGSLSSIAQNIMDVSHTVFVHGKLFRESADRVLNSEIEVGNRHLEIFYDSEHEELGAFTWLTNPKKEAIQHIDRYFAPNVTQVDYHIGDTGGFVFNSFISPTDEISSRVFTCTSYKMRMPKWLLKGIKPIMFRYTTAVNQQDVTAMNHQRLGLAGWPMGKPHSVRADMAHVAVEKILVSMRDKTPMPEYALKKSPMSFYI